MRRIAAALLLFTSVFVVVPPVATAAAGDNAPAVFYLQPTGRSVRFLWIEPNAPSYDHMVIRQRRGDNPILSPSGGDVVFRGRGTSYDWSYRYAVVRELDNDVTYSFAAFAYNEAGNVTWSDRWETTSNDRTGPLYPLPLMDDHNFRGTRSVTPWWKNPPDRDLDRVVVSLRREGEEAFTMRRTFHNPVPNDVHRTTFDGLDDGEGVMIKFEAYDDAGRFWDWSGVGISTLEATRIRSRITDGEIAIGERTTIVGHLEAHWADDDENDWGPVFERQVTLHRRPVGAAEWTFVDSRYTESAPLAEPAAGRVVFSVEPQANMEYQMRFTGDGGLTGSTSSSASMQRTAAGSDGLARTRSRIRTALVRAKVRATPASTIVRRDDAMRVRGTVWPARARGEVTLQRRLADGSWQRLDRAMVHDDGRFWLRTEPSGRGVKTYRVRRLATRRFASSGSGAFEVRVR